MDIPGLTSKHFSVKYPDSAMDPSPPGGGGEREPADSLEILTVDGESPVSSPVPTLTIGKVLDMLAKLKQGKIFILLNDSLIILIIISVTTPNINKMIALPFKKRPVSSREQFCGLWSEKKAFVARVGGKGASYKENKAQRRSEEWPWPVSPLHQSDLTGTPTLCKWGEITGFEHLPG